MLLFMVLVGLAAAAPTETELLKAETKELRLAVAAREEQVSELKQATAALELENEALRRSASLRAAEAEALRGAIMAYESQRLLTAETIASCDSQLAKSQRLNRVLTVAGAVALGVGSGATIAMIATR